MADAQTADPAMISLQIPTGENIVREFGIRSPVFLTVFPCLLARWTESRGRHEVAAAYDRWEDRLLATYGAHAAGEELFIRHTYLATIAKLMVWSRLMESTAPPQHDQIGDLLDGRLFARFGIENLDDDLFSGPAWREEESSAMPDASLTPGRDESGHHARLAPESACQVVRCLFARLQQLDLRAWAGDVLKPLYHDVVDAGVRRDLGEFY